MDVINDLSNDLAQAFIREDDIGRKLNLKDAKSFIANIESELIKLVGEPRRSCNLAHPATSDTFVSH